MAKFAKGQNSRNKFKMPKFAKGHNSNKFLQNLFKIESGDLLTIPYQLTKFQTRS